MARALVPACDLMWYTICRHINLTTRRTCLAEIRPSACYLLVCSFGFHDTPSSKASSAVNLRTVGCSLGKSGARLRHRSHGLRYGTGKGEARDGLSGISIQRCMSNTFCPKYRAATCQHHLPSGQENTPQQVPSADCLGIAA